MLLCACAPNDTPVIDDTTTPEKEETDMTQTFTFPIAPQDGAYSYAVIRNENSSQAEREAMIAIRRALESVYGSSPMPETQYATEDLSDEEITARVELLIGRTGRPESEAVYAELGENDYTIRTVGNKLVVLGKNDSLTTFAVAAFEKMIQSKPATLAADYNYTDSYVAGSYAGKLKYGTGRTSGDDTGTFRGCL